MKAIELLIALAAPACLLAQGPTPMPDLSLKPVRFTVVDSDGDPVKDALIEASRPGPGNATGMTDADGGLMLDLPAGRNLTVYVSRDGYYTTGGELWRGGLHKGPEGRLVPRELPDRFTIELKEVRDLVHMRHKRFRGKAPKSADPAGFDLRAGDWTAPYGSGATADLYFHFHDIYIGDGEFEGTMTITFPNEGDGIQPFTAARPFSMEFGSNLAPPHRAPVNGYKPSLSRTMAHRRGEAWQATREKGRNYLFRTRTVRDQQGHILKACYGWIQGEIEFDPRDPSGPQLAFAYFFNPDPAPEARSLEYNLHKPQNR